MMMVLGYNEAEVICLCCLRICQTEPHERVFCQMSPWVPSFLRRIHISAAYNDAGTTSPQTTGQKIHLKE